MDSKPLGPPELWLQPSPVPQARGRVARGKVVLTAALTQNSLVQMSLQAFCINLLLLGAMCPRRSQRLRSIFQQNLLLSSLKSSEGKTSACRSSSTLKHSSCWVSE